MRLRDILESCTYDVENVRYNYKIRVVFQAVVTIFIFGTTYVVYMGGCCKVPRCKGAPNGLGRGPTFLFIFSAKLSCCNRNALTEK